MKRFFKAVWYYLSFQFIRGAESIENNPGVVKAQYGEVIRSKKSSAQELKSAIAGIEAQRQKRLAELSNVTTEVEEMGEEKAGAIAIAQQRVAELQEQGKTEDEIEEDPEYREMLSLYNDISSTLEEKQARITVLEDDAKTLGGQVDDRVLQLESIVREIEKLQIESSEAVADIISAKEMEELNDTLSGIAEDGSAELLSSLRDRRTKAVASASISAKIAGTDVKTKREKLKRAARKSVKSDEFRNLVGVAKLKDQAAATTEKPTEEAKLPE